jgi:hypothetical protein
LPEDGSRPDFRNVLFSKQTMDRVTKKKRRLWHEIWKLRGVGVTQAAGTHVIGTRVWWTIVEGKVVPVYNMKACEVIEVQLHSFLTTVLKRYSSCQHYARPPYSGDRVPGTQGLCKTFLGQLQK